MHIITHERPPHSCMFVYLLQFLQSSLFLLQFADVVVSLAQVTCQSSYLEVQTLNTPSDRIQSI